MDAPLPIQRLRGAQIAPFLDDVARLRIAVFRDWPYLYAGDLDYEREYLSAYAASPDSVFVLVRDGERVVGASTGLPLGDAADAFGAAFAGSAFAVADVFYFGESVLLPAYRGCGVGHAFFDHREAHAHAHALGRFRLTAFCAVDRDPDDPRRPPGDRSNDAFWHKRGYVRQPSLRMQLAWDEIDRGEILHTLRFWTRPLEPAA
ncbi:GNAT family N-acetyltransferase [Xanthomonas translucens]|uniref:GNAT family acetyltransferase n=2 Tax=Xanthomonas campestris pv. translucens TaxID=343 RepID=A0A109HR18_XANCT|nr:GNAT family N-acetyltransferase [Xanthomonas translucens]AKK68269.1 GNAT family acetyltransferase [Xanthomonas translucens pv. undulosa]AVY66236.1 GNAT family acetyltransferase [Xanthomonas translucens pv. undulosa]ELP96602.1 hypothetical protein A989_18673 [Xanthomonas translucens DAR61454]KWV16605.1 GNAT family acetyltransferase [Xanthomonas translucens]MBC3972747.1 GNAT family N-acetyltransferase [Xanthomonas translucens pv. undulosa]